MPLEKNILVVSVLCFAVSQYAFDAEAQRRAVEPVSFHEITDNLYEITGGAGANNGLFIGESEVLLIDTKMSEESAADVFSGIAELTDKPVRYLINTHSDYDHVGGNMHMPEGVTIIAHENCRKEISIPEPAGRGMDWSTDEMARFLPSVTFTDMMTLHLGDTAVELWYFGVGHSTGDIVVYFPHARTAFVGDQVRFGRVQLIHSYKGGNSFGHVANLTRMLATLPDVERFLSGHNDAASRADVERHIVQMKERQAKVRACMNDGKNLEETQAMFSEDESRLIGSIFTEIETGADSGESQTIE
jgi:cyclase